MRKELGILHNVTTREGTVKSFQDNSLVRGIWVLLSFCISDTFMPLQVLHICISLCSSAQWLKPWLNIGRSEQWVNNNSPLTPL